jgi:hypothetical protein
MANSSPGQRPDPPSESNGFLEAHAALLCESFQCLTGRALVGGGLDGKARAEAVFNAPFAVVSHDTAEDPIFNYANRTAMALFEMSWQEFTETPSRCSAEPVDREERARLLSEVTRNGYIDNYSGVRISKTRRHFVIDQATVWNLIDDAGIYRGQAATFGCWRYL